MSGSADDAVRNADYLLSSSHHESKGPKYAGKADKKELTAKSDKEKSSENELFDEEREYKIYVSVLYMNSLSCLSRFIDGCS